MADKEVPRKKIALDEVNMGILRHLWDGRVPFSLVARDLGVSENTVRARVKSLQDQHMLEIIGLIDPEVLPGHSTAFVGIKAEPQSVMEVAEEASNLKGGVAAACVSGRYNVILFIMLNEEFGMVDFLDGLGKIQGVIEVEIFTVIKGFKFQCRYVL